MPRFQGWQARHHRRSGRRLRRRFHHFPPRHVFQRRRQIHGHSELSHLRAAVGLCRNRLRIAQVPCGERYPEPRRLDDRMRHQSGRPFIRRRRHEKHQGPFACAGDDPCGVLSEITTLPSDAGHRPQLLLRLPAVQRSGRSQRLGHHAPRRLRQARLRRHVHHDGPSGRCQNAWRNQAERRPQGIPHGTCRQVASACILATFIRRFP